MHAAASGAARRQRPGRPGAVRRPAAPAGRPPAGRLAAGGPSSATSASSGRRRTDLAQHQPAQAGEGSASKKRRPGQCHRPPPAPLAGRARWACCPAASASGVPLAITCPPSGPPPGPSSTSQSQAASRCGWCSTTNTDPPRPPGGAARRPAAARPPGAGRRSARPGCTACRPAPAAHSSLGDLEPLRLAARERVARLAQHQVAQAHLARRLQAAARQRRSSSSPNRS